MTQNNFILRNKSIIYILLLYIYRNRISLLFTTVTRKNYVKVIIVFLK